jgi:hypothetical protein
MIALLGVECQVLQLPLILAVVQYCLRKYDVFIDFSVHISEGGPLPGVDLHDIEHHLVLHLLLSVVHVLDLHPLKESLFLLLQLPHLPLRVHAYVAYGCPPPVHVPLLLLHALHLELIQVRVLNLGLSLPVLLEVLLSEAVHLLGVYAALVQKDLVLRLSHNCLVAAHLH